MEKPSQSMLATAMISAIHILTQIVTVLKWNTHREVLLLLKPLMFPRVTSWTSSYVVTTVSEVLSFHTR
jgi:hypothetical protein